MTASTPSVLLTATVCQSSYPLNSENARPPGTCTVYLSCAEMALLPNAASATAAIAIAQSKAVRGARLCRSKCVPIAIGASHREHFTRRVYHWPTTRVIDATLFFLDCYEHRAISRRSNLVT